MKCFIHSAKEAVAACRQCGKGMCTNCSAYSGHSGICPECKKKDLEKEYAMKISEDNSLKRGMIGCIVLAVLTCWSFVGAIIFGIMALAKNAKRKPVQQRIAYLYGEIDKLNRALNNSRAFI